MKKVFKRLVAASLCAVMMVSGATGCSKSKKAKYTVGICQLVQHEALDAATKGFKDALKEKLGDEVKFDEQNAQGDSSTCATIINGFVSGNYSLIMANATPALQAAANGTSDIPVLGTSITDYGTALGYTLNNGKTGKNVSGTSDLAPLDEQANLFKELLPNAKNVGILYCSAEPNSKFQADSIKGYLTELGYKCDIYTFTDSNDISSVVTSAVSKCDALYIPTDNTAASNTEIIDSIARPKKVPIITGEAGICKGCGIATISINYYDIGYETGLMAYEILKEGKSIKDMEIRYSPKSTKQYNKKLCDELGITVPSGYEEVK